MAGHHERAALASSRKSGVKIPCHAFAIMGTVFVIAPDDSGTAIGASAREFRDLILDLRPAERAEGAESRFKYDRGSADATAIHLDVPAADVGRAPENREWLAGVQAVPKLARPRVKA